MQREYPFEPVLVHSLTDTERPRWDAFVRATPAATFFHLTAWQGLLEEFQGHRTHFIFAQRAGEIVGVLPLAEVKSRLFGHSLSSLPFCAYGGVIACDEAAARALETEAERIATRCGAAHLELRNREQRHADWPRQDLYVSFRREIAQDDETNLAAIPRKQRAMVRKSIKNELSSHIDVDTRRFFPIYADNVRRHGTPALSARWFAGLMEAFGDACEVLTVTDKRGQPLSSVLSFYFRDEILPYYAGDIPAARDLAANDFKYWSLMQHAARRGCRIFDYGRSKVGSGPWSFKKNWGFEAQPLSYEYRLFKGDAIPQNNPANPKYRAFIALWRHLPLAVANRLGPLIVRGLG